MARLFRVLVPVSDIERAAAFYGSVLDSPGRRVSSGQHYFDCEGTILACYDPRADGDGRDARPSPEHIYLAVEDLEAAYVRVEAAEGVEIEDPIRRRPWGERSFYARDPFGNPLCFVDAGTVFTGEG
jgi:catechol 2,3-dioxygenase-like lactoylglutathione lyase family enzyme